MNSIKNKITKNFLETLIEEKKSFIPARTSKLPEGVVNDLLKAIVEHYELESTEQAICVLALLFQQGGTARGCDGNMSIVMFKKSFKLAEIRKILKQNSCNRSERKLARTLADSIHEIATAMEVPGNLYSKIQKNHLEKKFDTSEKAWLSDFQSDNENCPTELKTYILETFKNRKKKNF